MYTNSFSAAKVDAHVHLFSLTGRQPIENYRERLGFDAIALQTNFFEDKRINDNPLTFMVKGENPETMFVFGALDHANYISGGKVSSPSLDVQIDQLIRMGADGLKLLETKPAQRKAIDIPIDGDYYKPLFGKLSETGLPVMWHVADPETFWDPASLPGFAARRGWGYDSTFVSKEQLYSEVDNVLTRHPGLKVIFAHFYFLSADLPRAARLLDTCKNVHFDLAPGIELLYNLSQDVEATRDFFIRYSERIIFGTDAGLTIDPTEMRLRCEMLQRWLAGSETFRIPAGADYMLGSPEDGIIRGLSLPEDVLERIMSGNFLRIVGSRPASVDHELLQQESMRLAAAQKKF